MLCMAYKCLAVYCMKKPHLYEDPKRTTSTGMDRYAVDFFKAALVVADKLGTGKEYGIITSAPVMFLVGQSIE